MRQGRGEMTVTVMVTVMVMVMVMVVVVMFSHQLPRRPGEEGAIEGAEKSLRNGGQGDDDGECDDDDGAECDVIITMFVVIVCVRWNWRSS